MTSDPRWERLSALFDGALARPETEREDWLARECPDDDALRAEARRMLDAHTRSGGILDAALPVPPDADPDEFRRQVEAALGGRYAIESELGRGGSATVFLAHEGKHGRRVVLKVLDPVLARIYGAERFAREVRIAARLAHPHIVGLIDSGVERELYYYVMPWVEGETLRRLLRGGRRLSVAVALALLRDIADALAFAHRAGVVHRDLKPENVLVAGEHAYLLDFGVAKLLAPHLMDGPVTSQGAAIGTRAYLAPEQLRGQPDVDHRADIYAWGLVAWEMLTGELPLPGGSTTRELAASLAGTRPDAPRALVELVAHCLHLAASARPVSADLLLERLAAIRDAKVAGVAQGGRARRRPRSTLAVTLGVGAVLVAAVSAALLLRPRSEAGPLADGPVPGPIAVAALANETGDPSLDTWGRMAGDWLTQGLQSTGLLPVISWPASLQASERADVERRAGKPVNAAEVLSAETGAATVVTGAYYVVGDSMQFQVEVTDARQRRVLATLPAVVVARDSAAAAIRTLRERLMGSIALLFDERIAPAGPGAATVPPTYEAYQVFDRGLRRFNAQDYRGALPEFLAASRLDSAFVKPLLFAATAAWNIGADTTVDSLLRVLDRYQGALHESERWFAEAMRHEFEGDGAAAREALRRSAELSPTGREWYTFARVAQATDQPQEALDALLRVNPDRGSLRGWSSYWTQLTHAYHTLGRHQEELEAARGLRRRFPDRRVGLVLEARALAALGRLPEIDSVIARDQGLPPATYWSQGGAMVVAGEELWVHGHADAGRMMLERAIAWLETQRKTHPDYDGHRYWLADAFYNLERWEESRRLYEGLAAEFPKEFLYRGFAALAATHLGERNAEQLLGEPPPRQQGDVLHYRALIAAANGDASRAVALFGDAMRHGVDGLPWAHATARIELRRLAGVRGSLPVSLRAGAGSGP